MTPVSLFACSIAQSTLPSYFRVTFERNGSRLIYVATGHVRKNSPSHVSTRAIGAVHVVTRRRKDDTLEHISIVELPFSSVGNSFLTRDFSVCVPPRRQGVHRSTGH